MSDVVVGFRVSQAEASAIEDLQKVVRGVADRLKPAQNAEQHDVQNFAKSFSSIVDSLLQIKSTADGARSVLFLEQNKDSEIVNKACSAHQKIVKADVEERYILGIVLEPLKEMGSKDSQNDTYSAAEVRASAYKFMEDYGNVGLQHKEYVTGKVKIRENWITREDTTINGQFVHAGTWLLGVHVVDDDLWAAVKAGSFTGYSIGGWANRTKVQD